MRKLLARRKGVHRLTTRPPRACRGAIGAVILCAAVLPADLGAAEEVGNGWREALEQCISMTGTAPETASGRKLPRFVGLRFQTVNLRQGPDRAHRINWVYKRMGMPLLVIAEHHHWRRVCDFDGIVGWIHRSQLTASQNVMVMEERVPLWSLYDIEARKVAIAEKRVLLRLERCIPEWCLVSRGALSGWIPRKTLWGILER